MNAAAGIPAGAPARHRRVKAAPAGDRPPSYVSLKTIALELDISVDTLEAIRKTDRTFPKPKRHVGSHLRFSWAEIVRWMEKAEPAAARDDIDRALDGHAR